MLEAMIPVAHAGHWAVNLIYVLPLVVAVAVLGWQKLCENRPGPARGADDHGATRATEKIDH